MDYEVMSKFKITDSKRINEEDGKKISLDGIVLSQKDNDINVIGVGQNNLSPNLEKYYKIITKYKNGEFGDEHLSLSEILEAAGETDLLRQMSISEIQHLIDTSSGIIKIMFLEIKKQKTNSEDHIDGRQFCLSSKRKN